jgi:hypothetical protein
VGLDVRSLWDWWRDMLTLGRLSGGGALGVPRPDLDPGLDLDEASAGAAQEPHAGHRR